MGRPSKHEKHPDFPQASQRKLRGNMIWRFRSPDGAIDKLLPGEPGDECFKIAYAKWEKVMNGSTAEIVEIGHGVMPRSFGHAERLLLKTEFWETLADNTKALNQRHITAFLGDYVTDDNALKWKDVLIENLSIKYMRRYLDRLAKRKSSARAKHVLTAIRKLMQVAIFEEWVEYDITNPHLSYVAEATEGHTPWTDEYRHMYEVQHPIGTPARTAYALAACLGNRISDVANLRWDQLVRETVRMPDGSLLDVEAFHFRQQKNKKRTGGKEMFLIVTEELSEALAAIAGTREGTVLKTSFGKQYSNAGLGNRFRDWRREAEIPEGYSMHGLRKALGIDLVIQGASGRQVQDVLGHSSLQQVDPYVKGAEKRTLATDALLTLQARKKAMPKLRVVK
ncbi:tyrosine-type recombinase/integrase [Sinorhizobium fredii]|uniref:tyrosine-type recombinase/integrase n=1 Tax=Rhizobium fredii TaxID=380 RepID=UPI0006887FA8|nr:tyrosine-type recombinase/integrase [Sinorhizobium fredii]